MKIISAMLLVLFLSACGTLSGLDGKMENRLVCTVAGDKLYVVSEYGPVGLSSRISDKDREVVCKPPGK